MLERLLLCILRKCNWKVIVVTISYFLVFVGIFVPNLVQEPVKIQVTKYVNQFSYLTYHGNTPNQRVQLLQLSLQFYPQ